MFQPGIGRLGRVAGVLLLCAALGACDISVDGSGLSFGVGQGKAQDEWSRSYPLSAGAQLDIININGRITAEASDGSAVEVRAERTARASDDESAKALLGEIEMREEVGEGRVRIEVRTPRLSGLRGHQVQWTVRVPKGVNVQLRTVNGGVRLAGLDGNVVAQSTNGGVSGTRLRATGLQAEVTNGGVDIELANAPTSGSFTLESVNGGVTLAMPGDSRATISARCVNGGITVSGLDVTTDGERSRRRLQGSLNGGGARVSLETTNGGVRLSSSGA